MSSEERGKDIYLTVFIHKTVSASGSLYWYNAWGDNSFPSFGIPRSKGKRSKSLSDRNTPTTTTAQSKSFSIKQERVTNFLNSSNNNSHVRIISEKPFIISINTAQMNFPRKISNTSQKCLLTSKSRTKEYIDRRCLPHVPRDALQGENVSTTSSHFEIPMMTTYW